MKCYWLPVFVLDVILHEGVELCGPLDLFIIHKVIGEEFRRTESIPSFYLWSLWCFLELESKICYGDQLWTINLSVLWTKTSTFKDPFN